MEDDSREEVLEGLLQREGDGDAADAQCTEKGADAHAQYRQRVGEGEQDDDDLDDPADQPLGDALDGGPPTQDAQHRSADDDGDEDPGDEHQRRDGPVDRFESGRLRLGEEACDRPERSCHVRDRSSRRQASPGRHARRGGRPELAPRRREWLRPWSCDAMT